MAQTAVHADPDPVITRALASRTAIEHAQMHEIALLAYANARGLITLPGQTAELVTRRHTRELLPAIVSALADQPSMAGGTPAVGGGETGEGIELEPEVVAAAVDAALQRNAHDYLWLTAVTTDPSSVDAATLDVLDRTAVTAIGQFAREWGIRRAERTARTSRAERGQRAEAVLAITGASIVIAAHLGGSAALALTWGAGAIARDEMAVVSLLVSAVPALTLLLSAKDMARFGARVSAYSVPGSIKRLLTAVRTATGRPAPDRGHAELHSELADAPALPSGVDPARRIRLPGQLARTAPRRTATRASDPANVDPSAVPARVIER